MKIGKIEVENLKRWAEKKRITSGLYNEYWGGYVKALNDILELMKD